MQQFEPFKIVHVEGRNNECADSLSRLHLYNLMLPKHDNLSDEEARMAEAGEGGDDTALMNSTYGEMVHSVNKRYYEAACRSNHQFHRCNAMPPGEEYRNRGGVDGIAPVSLVPRDPDEKLLEKSLIDAELLTEVTLKQSATEEPVSAAEVTPAVAASSSSGVSSRSTAECQTNEADLRDARKRMSGCFPNRRMIERAHDYSHPSVATTWARVQRICGLAPGAHGAVSREEVRRYCEACPICQKLKPARERLERAAGTIRRRPFTEYSFDVIVLPEADLHGFRYILTVVDSFSGAVELFPLLRASAEEVSRCLVDVMCRWVRPHSVRCDNAKSFAAFMMQRLLAAARVEPHFVAPYSHQSNGQAENANRRVEHILRQMILDAKLGAPTRNNWSVLLPMVRGIINSKLVHRHGCTANELLYGAVSERGSIFEDEPWREDAAPSVIPPSSEAAAAAEETISQWRSQHEALLARCEAEQDVLLQKLSDLQGPEAADLSSLLPGDTVLVSSDERPVHKLGARWLGPYLVVSEPVGQRVTLQHLSSKRVSDFALNMCKRCDMSLMSDVDDWLPLAAADHFEYLVEAVEQHRPAQRRLPNGRLRPKSDFEFLVRWEGLPIDDENPSWEPWSNASLRSTDAFSAYLSRPEVSAALGADFNGPKSKGSDEASGEATRKRRR